MKTNLKFTKNHEWINILDEEATVGISSYAANMLGDIVYVELPNINKIYKEEEIVAVVESTKAASDVFNPINGNIIEVNSKIIEDPSLINSSPQDEGWFYKIKIANQAENYLMNENEYGEFVKGIS